MLGDNARSYSIEAVKDAACTAAFAESVREKLEDLEGQVRRVVALVEQRGGSSSDEDSVARRLLGGVPGYLEDCRWLVNATRQVAQEAQEAALGAAAATSRSSAILAWERTRAAYRETTLWSLRFSVIDTLLRKLLDDVEHLIEIARFETQKDGTR